MRALLLLFSIYLKIQLKKAAIPVPFIYGGYQAKNGQFPYQVSFQRRNIHICGGSILNTRWIVTAAHCIDYDMAYNVKVSMGSIWLGFGIVNLVIEAIKHENYDHIIANDIGLTKVEREIVYNGYVQPININKEEFGPGKRVIATGWGETEFGILPYLMYTYLTTVTNEECVKAYETQTAWNLIIIPEHICTIAPVGVGTCYGDSGGPLIYENELVGITSFGHYCALGVPDGFTRISSYVEWIEGIINKE